MACCIVSRTSIQINKSLRGLNEFSLLVAISTHRWQVVVSIYGLASPMYYHVLRTGLCMV
jgi:hypothetical protein